MDISLKDQVALVFGAGASGPGWGNGKAAAVAYARAGARVACVDLNPAAAEETAALIAGEGFEALALAADVAQEADVAAAVAAVIARWGRIDILHNNVGIAQFGGTLELDAALWDRSMDINVKGIFLACKHALPHMIARGRGVVTNISSIAGIRIAGYDMPAYYTSKAAVNHLTRALAIRHAREGIRVNAILPGLMNTPMIYSTKEMAQHHGDVAAQVAQRDALSPTGKMGDAWDIAHAAVFLASAQAKYINGIELPVDGGLTCRVG